MTSRSWTFRTAATTVALAAATATLSAAGVAQADSPSRPEAVNRHDPGPDKTTRSHDLKGPLSDTQAAQREEALKQVISGDASVKKKDGSNVVQLKSKKGDAKYVELGREKTDKIFTILVEFGDKVDSRYGGTPGPLHNQIAKPNRKTDNSTAWQEDYDQEHFQDLYFGSGKGVNSVKTYYEKQSSGRYSVDGEVSDWVKVPYNEARYGSNKCDPDNCAWYAVQDGVTAWVADQKAAGRTDAQIKSQLAQYDQWDRYDFDGDGDFNEPDGYIDHFQIVHAGEDESAGGGAQGEDAIWAHRWYAFGTDAGATGPADNKLGGTQIGDTGVWVGDYTIQPENGGLGVYAHEYGHDLGLPVLLRHRRRRQLHRLLDADVVRLVAGHRPQRDRRPARRHERLGQAPAGLAELLHRQGGRQLLAQAGPGRVQHQAQAGPGRRAAERGGHHRDRVLRPRARPKWWSGSGNDLKNTLSRSVDLTGKSSASLTLDGSATTSRPTTTSSTPRCPPTAAPTGPGRRHLRRPADPARRQRQARPERHRRRPRQAGYPLDAYAGKKIDLRFRYQTDGGLAMKGFTADEITVTADGATLFSDNAETEDAAWTANGFTRKGASFTQEYAQYYIAENRQYVSYDKTLQTGPYNFGFSERPNWVEHYAYQNGLLIWKWDTSQADNNTSQHPGKGLVLPVDSHPTALKWKDGTLMRNRFQAYDSPFSLYRTDGMTLHKADVAKYVPGSKGVSVFNDRKNDYYDPANPDRRCQDH
ncbi:M6 family metalloprotease domain-containing protein OS=Streptomyces tendae OX=1932 GN=GUR47_07820 PE=4 SV=1 [Streptomyces tendae]